MARPNLSKPGQMRKPSPTFKLQPSRRWRMDVTEVRTTSSISARIMRSIYSSTGCRVASRSTRLRSTRRWSRSTSGNQRQSLRLSAAIAGEELNGVERDALGSPGVLLLKLLAMLQLGLSIKQPMDSPGAIAALKRLLSPHDIGIVLVSAGNVRKNWPLGSVTDRSAQKRIRADDDAGGDYQRDLLRHGRQLVASPAPFKIIDFEMTLVDEMSSERADGDSSSKSARVRDKSLSE